MCESCLYNSGTGTFISLFVQSRCHAGSLKVLRFRSFLYADPALYCTVNLIQGLVLIGLNLFAKFLCYFLLKIFLIENIFRTV